MSEVRPISLLFVFCIVALAGCEVFQANQENARHALQVFCSLHKNDIFSVLLTPEQTRAGNIVCGAIGQKLGSD